MKEFKKKEVIVSKGPVSKLDEIDGRLNEFLQHKDASLDRFKIRGYLDEGSYAIVNLAVDHDRKEKVALKIYDKKTLVVKKRLDNLIVL